MMNDFINNRVKAHYNYLKSLGYDVVAIFAQGSMNYGLYIQDIDYKSDVDTKAIVLPSLKDLIRGAKMVSTKYDYEGEQIDVKDIRLMTNMWLKANPAYLEILFTDYKIINPKFSAYVNAILNMADDIVNLNLPQLAKCISGMSKEKVVALEHPYPSLIDKIEKFGYDAKQLHHIIRLNKLIKDIFVNNIPFGEALYIEDKDEREYLINVKKSILSLEDARKISKEKDAETKIIKDKYLEEHSNFEFNSEVKEKLFNIIYSLVEYHIRNEIMVVVN